MSTVIHKKPRKITVRTLQKRRERRRPITMVTAYDYPSARAAEAAGIDVILVGDSLAMVVLGYDTTLPVTMDEMLHHARAVRRGASAPLLIGDMPFMSYQTGPVEALANAGRYLKEAGMDAVKLEGGREVAATVAALVAAGIPVQGHVGLTPQSVHALGGYRIQGKTSEAAERLLEDALALEAAGCFSIVLEGVPARLATYITERLTVPTIGIGAGVGTSGQVLVYHDLLGLQNDLQPRFVKRFASLAEEAEGALRAYKKEVRAGTFPADEHSYEMADEEWEAFLASVAPAPSKPALAAVGG